MTHILDVSGAGRHLAISGALVNQEGLAPIASFDGINDYLYSASEPGRWDVTGAESFINAASRGLTLGGWFYLNAAGQNYALMTKGEGGDATTSYWLDISFGLPRFLVSGGIRLEGPSGVQVAASVWTWIVGRFTPSTEVALFVNQTKYVDTVGVPAALLDTAADFEIGSYNGGSGNFLAGKASLCFLCGSALGDGVVQALYQHTRVLFSQ